MDLDKHFGPASLRLWGLVINFAANALLLYGAVGYVTDGTRAPMLLLGAAATVLCVGLLSAPSR